MKHRHLVLSLSATALRAAAISASPALPKYVFLSLGDGMANARIQATEAYSTTVDGEDATVAADLLRPENRLTMRIAAR